MASALILHPGKWPIVSPSKALEPKPRTESPQNRKTCGSRAEGRQGEPIHCPSAKSGTSGGYGRWAAGDAADLTQKDLPRPIAGSTRDSSNDALYQGFCSQWHVMAATSDGTAQAPI